MKAKIDFLWYKKGDTIKETDSEYFKFWQEQGFIEGEDKGFSGDLDGDGDFDKDDLKIAAKTLSKGRSLRKKRAKK